jgi:hypothetical protein
LEELLLDEFELEFDDELLDELFEEFELEFDDELLDELFEEFELEFDDELLDELFDEFELEADDETVPPPTAGAGGVSTAGAEVAAAGSAVAIRTLHHLLP